MAAALARPIPTDQLNARLNIADGTVMNAQPGLEATEKFYLGTMQFPPGTCPKKGFYYQSSAKPCADAFVLTQTGKLQGYKNKKTGVTKKRGRDGRGGYDKKFNPRTHKNKYMANPTVYGWAENPYQKVERVRNCPVILGTREVPGRTVNGNWAGEPFKVFNGRVVPGSITPVIFEGKPTIEFEIELVNADATYPTTYPELYLPAPAAVVVAGG